MEEEKWALVGFDGKISILISNEIYTIDYMEACKLAEKKSQELGLVCGLAVSMKSIWSLLRESAKECNQEIFHRRKNE
jgi:hypothetical protein